jgi:hypothetical protein
VIDKLHPEAQLWSFPPYGRGLSNPDVDRLRKDPYGNKGPIELSDASLPPLWTAFTLTTGFQDVLGMVFGNMDLAHALNDLIAAITRPHEALVSCARAMDRIKHLIAPAGAKDNNAWQAMRTALRVDEAYLKFITDPSKGPRHGRPGYTPGSVTNEVTQRAWAIMNRYLEFRKAGGSLPAHFTLLSS